MNLLDRLKALVTPAPAVSIDSDYPDEAVMDAIRRLRVPPLTKTTESLFTETPAGKEEAPGHER